MRFCSFFQKSNKAHVASQRISAHFMCQWGCFWDETYFRDGVLEGSHFLEGLICSEDKVKCKRLKE